MSTKAEFPTLTHRRAAEAIVDFSIGLPVQAVLLVNSCARGTATPESDLDIALLVDPELPASERQWLDHGWRQRYENDSVFRELERLSRFARVHLDIIDGRWVPEPSFSAVSAFIFAFVPPWSGNGARARTRLEKCGARCGSKSRRILDWRPRRCSSGSSGNTPVGSATGRFGPCSGGSSS